MKAWGIGALIGLVFVGACAIFSSATSESDTGSWICEDSISMKVAYDELVSRLVESGYGVAESEMQATVTIAEECN